MAGTRQFCEEQLLKDALLVFWKQGYQGTSMLDLAKATGVQRGSLYNAYQNKSALFTKAFEQYSQRLLNAIETSLQEPSLKSALVSFFDFLMLRLSQSPDNSGCLSTRAVMEICHSDKEIKQQLIKLLDAIETTLYQRLMEAQKKGEFKGDSQVVARYLVALSRGLAVIEKAYGDPKRVHEIYSAAIDMLPLSD